VKANDYIWGGWNRTSDVEAVPAAEGCEHHVLVRFSCAQALSHVCRFRIRQ